MLKVSAVKGDAELQWQRSLQLIRWATTLPGSQLPSKMQKIQQSHQWLLAVLCRFELWTNPSVLAPLEARSGWIKIWNWALGHMLCIFTLTGVPQGSVWLPLCFCSSQLKCTKSRFLCGLAVITDVGFYCTSRYLVWIKRRSTLASLASRADQNFRDALLSSRGVLFSPLLFQSAQLPYGAADSSPAGWSRVVRESAQIQLVRRSQPKSSGPNCHFVQTPAQLSAAEPPATLRGEQWSADLTLAEAGEGGSEAGVFHFDSKLWKNWGWVVKNDFTNFVLSKS